MSENIKKFEKFSIGTGLAALAIFSISSPLLSNLPYQIKALPFLISMVFLGLPHGAMDHLVPFKLGRLSRRNSIGFVISLYFISGGIYIILWLSSPLAAVFIFILITWFHWGQGDIFALRKIGFDFAMENKWYRTISQTIRGGLPMLAPFIAYPEKYLEFISSLISISSLNTSFVFAASQSSLVLATTIFLAFLICFNSIIGYILLRKNSLKLWIYDNIEIGVLLLYFLSVPPLLSIGLYFCLWHSVRHIMRMSIIENQKMSEELICGKYQSYLRTLGKETFLITLISVSMLVVINILVLPNGNFRDIIALYLIFISVLTLPHVILVTWMDIRQY